MLTEESNKYLFVFRAFLFNERVKSQDHRIQLLIDEIDQELSRRRKALAGSVR